MQCSSLLFVSSAWCASLIVIAGAAAPDAADSTPAPEMAETQQTTDENSVDLNAPADVTVGQVEALLRINAELETEVKQLRHKLAKLTVEHGQAREQLDELRQFIHDHDSYGDDYARYSTIRAIAEREEYRKRAEARKARQEQERAERLARRTQRNAERQQERMEQKREAKFRDAGFAHIGLDVYTNRMAFAYHASDEPRTRIDYDPFIGNYLRFYDDEARVDYSKMTISGSVLNAFDAVRNIGVGIAFFDENGNQVGSETIQLSNARPNVPYPFTSEIDMALDRAFSTSSVYVLYADPAEE